MQPAARGSPAAVTRLLTPASCCLPRRPRLLASCAAGGTGRRRGGTRGKGTGTAAPVRQWRSEGWVRVGSRCRWRESRVKKSTLAVIRLHCTAPDSSTFHSRQQLSQPSSMCTAQQLTNKEGSNESLADGCQHAAATHTPPIVIEPAALHQNQLVKPPALTTRKVW